MYVSDGTQEKGTRSSPTDESNVGKQGWPEKTRIERQTSKKM